MTRIGIVGAGIAATMHAEAVLNTRAATLVGVGGRVATGEALGTAANVPHLDLESLIAASDALVIASPPETVADIVAMIGSRVRALLIESPLPLSLVTPVIPTMVAANLLHAPTVRLGLAAIAKMNAHHLQLRSTQPRPTWGSHGTDVGNEPLLDPGARLLPVLLAAAGSSVVGSERRKIGPAEDYALRLELTDGRTVEMRSSWAHGEVNAELEAADTSAVVQISFFPFPRLEIDGQPIEPEETAAVRSLGFVNQIERLARVAKGDAEPWLPLASGQGIRALLAETSGHTG
ncbi:MAG: Gfo/Idh/MocA family oxidoreductase [Acidimicrobiales bacterium]|nr:Gfo/Idh/MocA family oxidoreductase [Acidimicrobiales bacterium]